MKTFVVAFTTPARARPIHEAPVRPSASKPAAHAVSAKSTPLPEHLLASIHGSDTSNATGSCGGASDGCGLLNPAVLKLPEVRDS